MISIDTIIMRSLVAAATTANDAITDAMDVLNRISSHNDWACKEKDAINTYTSTNKNRIRLLQENSSALLNAITSATAEFEDTENSISDMFSSVETILSNLLSIAAMPIGIIGDAIKPDTQVVPIAPTLENILKDILPTTRQDGYNPFENFSYNNILEPIPICYFRDIDLG